jgi:hypothetical protein
MLRDSPRRRRAHESHQPITAGRPLTCPWLFHTSHRLGPSMSITWLVGWLVSSNETSHHIALPLLLHDCSSCSAATESQIMHAPTQPPDHIRPP